MPFLFFNTQTMHIKPIVHNSIATRLIPYTLAGFEPGSFVLEVDF
jgi:hypothetical protein